MQLRRTRSAPGRSARRRRGSLRGRRSVDGDAASGSVANDPSAAAARERAAPIGPRAPSDRSRRCSPAKQPRRRAAKQSRRGSLDRAGAAESPPEFPAHARVANPRALPGPTGRSPPPCPRTTSSPRSDRLDRFVPAAGQEGGVRRAPGSANLPRPEGCSPRGRSSRDSRSRPRHAGNHTDGCRPSRPGAVPGATCAPANLPCDGSAGWSHRLDAARSPRPIGRAQRGRKSRQVLIRYIGIRTRGFVQASGSRRG